MSPSAFHRFAAPRPAALAAAALAVVLAGCGPAKDKATQVAAKVNKEEISVHQVNYVLQQQRGLKPEQAEAAGRQALERLIDQELAMQRAEEMKLDRDPRVLQQIDAARREIVARAYAERAAEAAPRPGDEEIKRYYDSHPWLFRERRVYNVQELAIEATPEQVESLKQKLAQSKSLADFVEKLKAENFRFVGNQAVRAAEQLPLTVVEPLSKLKDGQSMLLPAPTGAQVVMIAASKLEPVDEAKARPAIERFLVADARRKAVEAELKHMRADARIEYVGRFAKNEAGEPLPNGTAATSGSTASTQAPATPVATTPPAAAPARAASGNAPLSADDISKGLGLRK